MYFLQVQRKAINSTLSTHKTIPVDSSMSRIGFYFKSNYCNCLNTLDILT